MVGKTGKYAGNSLYQTINEKSERTGTQDGYTLSTVVLIYMVQKYLEILALIITNENTKILLCQRSDLNVFEFSRLNNEKLKTYESQHKRKCHTNKHGFNY